MYAVLLTGAPVRNMGPSSKTQHKPSMGLPLETSLFQRVLEEGPMLRTG